MFSVDIAERYHYDVTKPTGYLIEEMNSDERSFHKLMTGEILPKRFDEIGKDVDFLILDTVHTLQGEVLDFLAIFPYLKNDAIVVLHDTALHHFSNSTKCIATNVLFHTVTAEKFLNNTDELPNIAAFKINDDTKKYILDLFYCLTLPWEYMPDEDQIKVYDRIYSEHYDKDALWLWEQAKKEANKFINNLAEKHRTYFYSIKKAIDKNSHVLIYGAGCNGKCIFDIISKVGIKVDGFVISDGQYQQDAYKNTPVYYFSEIPKKYSNASVIMSFNSDEIKKLLKDSGYDFVSLPEWFFETLYYINLDNCKTSD